MIRRYTSTNRGNQGIGIRLLLGACVLLGLTVGTAPAQITPDTMATASQELTDGVIMDIFITSNEGEVMTSEVIAGEEAPMPEEEPMGPPEEEPMEPPEEQPEEGPPMEGPPEEEPPMEEPMEDTMGVGQDTMYGEGQQPQAGAEQAGGAEPGAAMGQDASVQEFARRMIDEHGRLNEEAQQLSDSLGLEPESNLVSTVLQNTVEGVTEELRGTSSDSLNQEYMIGQVALHQQTLGMLEHTLIPNAEDESLRGLLEEARGIVEQHLDQARGIVVQMGQEQYPQPAE